MALLIETTKGIRPYLLDDLTAPEMTEADAASGTHRLATQRNRVLLALRLMDGAITATCVQAVVGCRRNHASQTLKQLKQEGSLRTYPSSIRLGIDCGRPITLYVDNNVVIRTAHEVIHRTWADQTVVNAWRKGFDLKSFEVKQGLITLQQDDDPCHQLFCLVNSPELQVGEFFARIESLLKIAHRKSVIALMADPDRIQQLKRFFPEAKIHNLTEHRHLRAAINVVGDALKQTVERGRVTQQEPLMAEC